MALAGSRGLEFLVEGFYLKGNNHCTKSGACYGPAYDHGHMSRLLGINRVFLLRGTLSFDTL